LIEACDKSSNRKELEERVEQELLEAVKKSMKQPKVIIQEEEVALEEVEVLEEVSM